MGDAFDGVLNGMRKIVHREDAPLGPLPVMIDIADPVDDGIPHIEVAARKVDLGPERHLPFFHFAVLHHFKQAQIFLDRPVTVRRSGRDADISAVFAEFLR